MILRCYSIDAYLGLEGEFANTYYAGYTIWIRVLGNEESAGLEIFIEEIMMLRWMCCKIRKGGKVRNDDIQRSLKVAPMEENVIKYLS